MGTSTILDILGSLTTFGLLLIATLELNANASESNYAYTQSYLLQRNMVVLTTMLEDDLKHVGSGVSLIDPTITYGGIQRADTADLIFLTVLPGSNVVNTVEWRFESGLAGPYITPPMNTNIHYLNRIVDGVPNRMNLGVTRFTINYWNVYDPTSPIIIPPVITPSSVPNTGNIGPVSVLIRLESAFKMKQEYTSDTVRGSSQYEMVWRQIRSVSRNNSIQFPQ
jgi:hypothetical protein